MSVKSVGHELELSVRRNEGDGAVVLEARQTNALVKLDVLQLNRFTLSAWMERFCILKREKCARQDNTCTMNHESGQAEGSSTGYMDTAQARKH